MNVINFSDRPSLITQYLAELRDVNVQNDRMRVRTNLERLSFCMAYEISKALDFSSGTVQTPLADAEVQKLSDQPVIAFVLRAGLSMQSGFVKAFDHADHCFISAYREEGTIEEINVHLEYLASPDLTGRIVIMIDPMLATGQSMVGGYEALLKNGKPKALHVVSIVAAPQGVEYVKQHLTSADTLWLGCIDDGLNERAYIVPGLGDAGDLAFGPKL